MKIVLAFEFSIGDKEAVDDAGFERFRLQTIDGGNHSLNRLTVGKGFDGIGAGVSDKVPDGQRHEVRLQSGERNDFDFGQFVIVVEAEKEGKCWRGRRTRSRPRARAKPPAKLPGGAGGDGAAGVVNDD